MFSSSCYFAQFILLLVHVCACGVHLNRSWSMLISAKTHLLDNSWFECERGGLHEGCSSEPRQGCKLHEMYSSGQIVDSTPFALDYRNHTSASVFWQNTSLERYSLDMDVAGRPINQRLAFDSVEYNATYITYSGLCIADKAYSWGFSSLLLLTFCVYTLTFAATLVSLQTDVYWNSRSDRGYQAQYLPRRVVSGRRAEG